MERKKRPCREVFETSYHDIDPIELSKLPNDPFSKELKLEDPDYLHTLKDLPTAKGRSLLCIESVLFYFAPDLSEPEDEDFDGDGYNSFIMYIRDVTLILQIINSNELLSTSYQGEKRMFLVRNVQSGWVKHFLLLLRPAGKIFERCGVVSLEVH